MKELLSIIRGTTGRRDAGYLILLTSLLISTVGAEVGITHWEQAHPPEAPVVCVNETGRRYEVQSAKKRAAPIPVGAGIRARAK